MIGYRGCFRYIREPDLFALEIEVLARVREQAPNLHLMIPFVRTKWELEACLEAVDRSPLGSDRHLLRWVMASSTTWGLPRSACLVATDREAPGRRYPAGWPSCRGGLVHAS